MGFTKKPKVIDLSYFYAKEISDYNELIKLYESSSGHHDFLANQIDLYVIRHLNQNLEIKIGAINYLFFKGGLSKFWLPFRLHKIIASLNPDIILIHSFLNPLQVLLLSFQTKAKIVIQYHGGRLPMGITALLQKMVKYRIKNYVFTAINQSNEFIEKGLMLKSNTVFSVMEGSTNKIKIDKFKARLNLGIDTSEKMFLWVGRLDENKDPLTVLKGMEQLFKKYSNAILYMVFSDEKLIKDVKNLIQQSEVLSLKVKLIGKLPHHELDNYYNSADFFLLGSHYEGSGYALCEAMACGCIPIVTNIPSFRMMTNDGKIGALWQVGNKNSFIEAAEIAMNKDIEKQSESSVTYFKEHLSFEAIAKKQLDIFNSIIKD